METPKVRQLSMTRRQRAQRDAEALDSIRAESRAIMSSSYAVSFVDGVDRWDQAVTVAEHHDYPDADQLAAMEQRGGAL